jgi:hypothetical protein
MRGCCVNQLVLGGVHKQAVMSQEIDTDDWKLHIGEEECPGEPPAAEA